MTLVNVASGIKREEIKKMLENQTCPKYKFVGMLNDIDMQFETENCGFDKDIVRHTKMLIRSLPYGKVLMFRVLYDGQVFENGKIWKKGDPVYDQMHRKVQ